MASASFVNPAMGDAIAARILKPGQIDPGVTKSAMRRLRNWRRWLEPANRLRLSRLPHFAKPSTLPDPATGRKVWTWFALGTSGPLFLLRRNLVRLARRARNQESARGGDHSLYGFLTTAPPTASSSRCHERAIAR